MNKEDIQIIKRYTDLSVQADRRDHIVYSDFLNMNEISLLHEKKADYSSAFSLYGGYPDAERQIAAFYPFTSSFTPEDMIEQYPIACIVFRPVNKKFADVSSHRDVLGAVMNLGIERKKIGDIVIKEQQIYVLCHKLVAQMLLTELTKIKHTVVSGQLASGVQIDICPQYEDKEGSIASNRLDAFVSEICNLSRNKASEMILGEKVFINGRMISNHNQKVSPGDVISFRGYGKVRFNDFLNTTKKGKIRISYSIYK